MPEKISPSDKKMKMTGFQAINRVNIPLNICNQGGLSAKITFLLLALTLAFEPVLNQNPEKY
jgi:hypothetical protein